MANEITVTASLSFTKGGVSASMSTEDATFTMSGTDYFEGTQTVGTSEEALDIGDITTCGWVWIKNLDSTNFVELRANTGEADLIKLKAGECALFRLTSSTPYAIADTANCQVWYLIVED